jgi:hypothetical protein
MSGVDLVMAERLYSPLREHLLSRPETEAAAYAYVRAESVEGGERWRTIDWQGLGNGSYERQTAQHLVLADEVLPQVIKRAHDANLGLVEFHSHPYSRRACFSLYDIHELRGFAPYIRWRLHGAVYGAVVISPSSFDGLIWSSSAPTPTTLRSWCVEDIVMKPTALGEQLWREESADEQQI